MSRRIERIFRVARRGSLALAASGTLLLCSCRAPSGPGAMAGGPMGGAAPPSNVVGGTLPPQAWTGAPGDGYTVPGPIPGYAGVPPQPMGVPGPPLPYMLYGNWAPPGIARPWPADEYIHDGGDQAPLVKVTPDQQVLGLELEDTVVHYDNQDGCCEVAEPTNRVDIYAPRFAAVRKVEAAFASDQTARVVGLDAPIGAIGDKLALHPGSAMAPLQPVGDVGVRHATLLLERQQAGGIVKQLRPFGTIRDIGPHEDFGIIRFGVFEQREKARLAEHVQAAITWTHDLGVQIIIDDKKANVLVARQAAQETFEVNLPGCPRLQVCKVASTHHALPGEFVDFTIRFDNVGQQPAKNVKIVDNLTTRLEYVPDSAQSSVETQFSVQPNGGDSLVLRWDLTEPLKPGDGGLVRFRCRVR